MESLLTIAEPLEKQVEAGGGLVAHAQAPGPVGALLAEADVVLEQALGAVVGEALRQLDDGDEVGRRGQVLADAAQRRLLVVVGLLAVGRRRRLRRHGGEVLLLRACGGDGGPRHVLIIVVGALAQRLVQPASFVFPGQSQSYSRRKKGVLLARTRRLYPHGSEP